MWWTNGKARKAAAGKKTLATPMIMFLEPRMLFDGAVAATVADAAQADSHATADAAAKAPATDQSATASKDTHAQTDAPVTPAPVAVPGQSVVFVDARVKDSAELLKGVAPGTQVVQLDATKDGLQQIADYLGSHQGVSSVQIIAHGNAGDLWLGTTYLSADNVAARADVLGQIGQDMNVGGDILIYACYTAEGERGVSFVDSIAQLTGRDVAASTNRTGIGGDWDLEIATGSIESVNALSTGAMRDYQWGLATWTATNTLDTGVGSLRASLASAQNGDIVTFSSSMTVALNTQLAVSKNITLDGDLNNDGVADVTLDGQYKTSVIQVASGTTVKFDGLVITRGLIAGNGGNGGVGSVAANSLGAGISNFGDLTLVNVSVTANAASGGGGGGGVTGGAIGGGGGGGGAVGGGIGGHGGSTSNATGNYAGTAGSANQGGTGGGYNLTSMGGKGGSSAGGAASVNPYGYSNGGVGGAATAGSLSIGGGGGGAGWNSTGGKGGAAAGGIYNASGAKLTIIGTSAITGNVGAGGAGGGGGSTNSGSTANGGDGGLGVGAIWNKGTVLITAANFATLGGTANGGASGNGGLASAGTTGNKPAAVPGLYNDVGGTSNNAYVPAPVATLVVANTAQHIGSTSGVTITFSEQVTGFTNADLTVSNGTLSAVSSADGGTTWTATFTPNAGVTSAANQIVLDNTGVTGVTSNAPGTGSTASNSFAIDTQAPTSSITVSSPTVSTSANGTVSITFSEAVSGFSLSDMTASNGTLSNLTTSDNIHWTATLTAVAGNLSSGNVITLNNALYTDSATNVGSGTTTSNTYIVDTVRPTASIVVSSTVLNAGGTSLVTFTFSEAVSGFTTADLTVANGTVSGLSSSDGGITWTGTLAATAGITDTSNVITLANVGVNDAAGNTGTGTTDSNNYAVDTQRPTATIVVADNALKIGETSLVTITFTEAVSGFTNADLNIANGTLSAVSSADGGITWTATLTPSTNLTDTTNVITLDNTGVIDSAGNTGTGSTPSNNYAIDTQRPTSSVVLADNALKIGDTSLVTITFSEAVSGFTNADLTVANGTLTAVSSSNGGVTWTATFTPTSNITDTSNVITLDNTGIADLSGNAGSGTTDSNNYAIDTQRPIASIVLADTSLSAGETSLVTITFSEAVSGFTNADLAIANGTLTAVSSSDGGTTWTATFTPTASVRDTTNVITLSNTGVTDLAGNAGSGTTNSANYVVDTVAPTATIVVADNALSVGETSLVTITFSEAVTGFTNADLTVANGTLGAVSSADGGVTWTATFTPTTAITAASNLITLDNSGVQGASSGNPGFGSSSSNTFAIDTQRPTATIAVADAALAIGQTTAVTITFSEAVTGLTVADFTANNGTLSGLTTSDNITYTATFTPTAGTTSAANLITLDNTGVADVAGNAGAGSSVSNTYAIDSQRPTATIVIADPALSAGETTLVTITFSEAVSGFDNGDLSVPNGTLSNVSSSDGGITWTATFTPTVGVKDTSNLIALNNAGVADLAGNVGTGVTNSANFSVDTVLPTATIVVADNALKLGETSLVTVTFSEAVSGFSNADLTVANGTLSNVASLDGGITWTATLTPTSAVTDTTNLITLDNSGVTNASGNAGSGSTDSNNYAIDTQRPTATIVVANAALLANQTSLVTITFSEAVTGLNSSDLSVANGTLTNLASRDGGVTWTATLTPFVGVANTSNVVRLDNTGVQDAAGNSGVGSTDSNTYLVDTQLPTATIVVANPTLNAGGTSLVTVTFSEPVRDLSNSIVFVTNGTLSTLVSADGGRTWTGVLTPNAGIDTTGNVVSLYKGGVQDLAGNFGFGQTLSNTFDIHTARPTATIQISDPILGKYERQNVTVRFSEAVTGFSLASLQAPNGTFSELTMYSATLYTVVFTPKENTTASNNVITLDTSMLRDAHGNVGLGNVVSAAFTVDTVLPTATLALSDSLLEPGETATVTVTFSEPVTGFDNRAIVNLQSATLSTFYTTDNGTTWQATLTPTPGAGSSGSYLIGLSTAYVRDLAGNANYAMDTPMVSYQVDHTPLSANIYLSSERLNANGSTTVDIYFNKAVSNFDLSDLSADNGALSNLRSSDGGVGKSWQATLTPLANTVSAQNVVRLNNAGVTYNGGSTGVGISSSRNYTVDTQRPTSTIVIDKTRLAVGEQATVTVTFSEAVEFSTSPFSANANLTGMKTVDGGITWTFTLTPRSGVEASGQVISLNNTQIRDLSGNAGSGISTSNAFAIDTQRPTANISIDKSLIASGETANVTLTFREPVTGLTLDNLGFSAGTLSDLKSLDGGTTWTATLTPNAHTQISISSLIFNGKGVTDAAGNTAEGRSAYLWVDTEGPLGRIQVSDTELKAGQGTEVIFMFNESVAGFDLAGVQVQNGTLSNLQNLANGYVWSATLTPNDNVNAASNVISLDPSAIRDGAGNPGAGVIQSNAYAINSVSVTADPLTLTGGIVAPVIDGPRVPLQPIVFTPPTGNLGSPLTFAPLFEQRVLGDGIRPLGDIFIHNGASTPSYIAQVFASSDSGLNTSAQGFLGFGGGDGGVFGSSTLSGVFNRDTSGSDTGVNAFDSRSIRGNGDPANGLRGVFGAPTLGQQLQQLKDSEQRQVIDLAHALQQVGISEMQA